MSSMDVELREIRDFLAQHAPFDALPPKALNALPRECTVRYHRRGTVILDAGEMGDGLYVVRSGAVDITDETGGLIERAGAGRGFGTTTLIEQRPTRYACTAIEDTLVIVLNRDAFARLVAEHPAVETFYAVAHHERLTTAIHRLRQATSGATVLGTSVDEVATRDVVAVGVDATIREAAVTMAEHRVSSLLVREGESLVGILTDRDLRERVVAAGLDTSLPVTEVMTRDPITLPRGSLAFEALLEMSARNIHHLPLVDTAGRPTGLVTTTDLTRLERSNPVYLAADVARQQDLVGVVAEAHRIPGVVAQLVDQDVTAADLGRITTALGDAVRRRVVALVEADLGTPPAAYAWLALGSAAREEEGLGSDQDHGLVVAEDGHDAWFAALAEGVTDVLEQCGWPRCPGEVMATNPQWRMTPDGWRRKLAEWAREPKDGAVLALSTVLDMRHLAGDPSLTSRVLEGRTSSPLLVGHLAAQATRMRPPLGFFRNFVLEHEGEHRDTLDIKRGISAVVQVARVLALRAGSGAVGTLARIDAATDAGSLDHGQAEDLKAALELMEHLRLRHQVAQLRSGEQPDNHLAPSHLSERERRHLRDAFGIVRSVQSHLAHIVGPGYD
jgi:CBS domain-containing protein